MVQRGTDSVLWKLFSAVGDNISTCREITSVHAGDNISTCREITSVHAGDNISIVEITSVLWKLFSTVGYNISTVEVVQYSEI